MVQKRSRRLSWSGIEAILLVARHGTVRAAAGVLGVAHTTLAHRISVAEAAMGVPAFIKGTTGYKLTDEGKAIVERAEFMASEAEELERYLDGAGAALSGDVRVSLNSSLLKHIVAPAVKILADRHPGIRMHFDTGDAFSNLDKREADVVLRLQREPQPSLYGRKLCSVYSAAYVGQGMTGVDLQGSNPVPVVGWSNPDAVSDVFSALGLKNIQIRANAVDIDAQAAIAKSTPFVVEIPCYVGDKDPQLMRLPGTSKNHLNDLWLLTHESIRKSPRIRAVFEALSAAVLQGRTLLEGDVDDHGADGLTAMDSEHV